MITNTILSVIAAELGFIAFILLGMFLGIGAKR